MDEAKATETAEEIPREVRRTSSATGSCKQEAATDEAQTIDQAVHVPEVIVRSSAPQEAPQQNVEEASAEGRRFKNLTWQRPMSEEPAAK